MWPNPQEKADWVTLLKKYLMENFIFCALLKLTELEHFSILKTLPSGSSS